MLGPITLIYHDIIPAEQAAQSGFSGADADHYKISPETFARHLDLIAGQLRDGRASVDSTTDARTDQPDVILGASVPIEVSQLLRQRVCLTFDDGGACSLRITAEQLSRDRRTGVFLIPTDHIGTPGFLSASEIRELRRLGHTIGVHSASHPIPISKLSRLEIREEWRRSREMLEQIICEPVRVGSVPGGFTSPVVEGEAAEAGLALLFTSEPTRRVRKLSNLLIAGRFSVTRATSLGEVAALASGAWAPQLSQRARWEAKALAKRVLGTLWLRLRRKYFGSR